MININKYISNLYWDHDKYKCWWNFNWSNQRSKEHLLKFFKDFVFEYIKLTKKYKILIPIYNIKLNNFTNLNQLYNDDQSGNFFYKCLLFTYNEDMHIELKEVNDVNKYDANSIREPLYIWNRMFSDSENLPYIYINISSDVFFPNLNNHKTWNSENESIKKNGIDNSELAYLNTPRFNSFFRDFKKLCISYGAEFSYEINVYDTEDLVSPDGIFLDEEIIYYEDIVDILDEKYRIVDLSINTDFS